MDQTIKTLLDHVTIRNYDTARAVAQEVVATIIRCAQMAPTSSHFQAYTIIRVNDSEKRALLAEASGNQKYVNEAPVTLLFCADLHRAAKYYENIDINILSNTEFYTIAVVDTAIAGQKALIAAQSLGLGGVMIGGLRNDIERVHKAFKLPELVFPLFALCLGYAASEPAKKPRLPVDVVLKQDFYDESRDDELIGEYNEQVRRYYSERTNGTEDVNWTERCGKYVSAKPREEVGPFLRKIGFLQR